jgi:hypothetical protein
MSDQSLQTSLFEDDYLLRELGQLAHVPQIALTELVANAWDAGATKVVVTIPPALNSVLTVDDDGHGMTPMQFKERWMRLRYDRSKRQGRSVEFPPGRICRARKAYGRNGVGRHGLLCFGNTYEVETRRDGVSASFVVTTQAGASPFVARSEETRACEGTGTKLSVRIERNLPDVDEILTVLSARFFHDPEFEIWVNGKRQPVTEIEGVVSSEELNFGADRSAKVFVIDSTRANQSSIHQGIAFWSQRRLVGEPSWALGSTLVIDGRTSFAKRYKVIVDTVGFESEVEQDWTGFRKTETVRSLLQATSAHVQKVAKDLFFEYVEEASEEALSQNRAELEGLGEGARLEVAEFTRNVAWSHPTISPDFLASAVDAVINLEKSKSGASLLKKLAQISHDDVDALDQLLSEWSVKDALRVLDEVDSRLRVVEAIDRLASDPTTDELHTLHPLILRSRWLFGPEFESDEYCSNSTLRTIATELFGRKEAQFVNDRNRPDIVVLPDKTSLQITGVEAFDPLSPATTQLQSVLLIELKKGGFKLTREEMNQADGYAQDIVNSGALTKTPRIFAWVVGQSIAAGTEPEKQLGIPAYGFVRATTFSTLVSTANMRMLRLRTKLQDRYASSTKDELLERVFARPAQGKL